MKKLFLGIVLPVFFFAGSASALVFVEPYGGLGMGAIKYDLYMLNTGGEVKTADTIFAFGARAGAEFMMFFGGIDVQYGIESSKPKTWAGNDIDNAESDAHKHLMFGLVAGVELPMLPLRFWAGYNFVDKFSYDDEDDGDTTLSGSGMKFGAGFKVIPMLSINLEYYMHTFKKIEDESGYYWYVNFPAYEKLAEERRQSRILLTASIPLSLM